MATKFDEAHALALSQELNPVPDAFVLDKVFSGFGESVCNGGVNPV